MRKIVFLLFCCIFSVIAEQKSFVLNLQHFEHYVNSFNLNDDEIYSQFIPNKDAWRFMVENIPFIDVPDATIEEIYYFRWWTFRKHIKKTDSGFVITEFLPTVSWAGTYNIISCAAGHHFREGRWLHNSTFLEDYARIWFSFQEGVNPRQYSFWAADSIRNFGLVTGSENKLYNELFSKLVLNFETMGKTNYNRTIGLYYNTDNRDGMEFSISGAVSLRAYRPTLNSYMYGEAMALAKMARSVDVQHLPQVTHNGLEPRAPHSQGQGQGQGHVIDPKERERVAQYFLAKARALKFNINNKLWDRRDHFFKAMPVEPNPRPPQAYQTSPTSKSHVRDPSIWAGSMYWNETLLRGYYPNTYPLVLVDVRELHGYTPWYFLGLTTDSKKLISWKQIVEKEGFSAPYGLTTAEQRHPRFSVDYLKIHECQWNGPVWPYSSSITLTALANILNNQVSPETFNELSMEAIHSSQQQQQQDQDEEGEKGQGGDLDREERERLHLLRKFQFDPNLEGTIGYDLSMHSSFISPTTFFRALKTYALSHHLKGSEAKSPLRPSTTTQQHEHQQHQLTSGVTHDQHRRLQATVAVSPTAASSTSSSSSSSSAVTSKSSDPFLKLRQTAKREYTGKELAWIDENLDPYTGEWISRKILSTWEGGKTWSDKKGGKERGKDYNHSTFIDLILSGLFGIRPSSRSSSLILNPLLPDSHFWPYFCVDQLKYHGKYITVLWDRDGTRYGKGKGFKVWVDGQLALSTESLGRVRVPL